MSAPGSTRAYVANDVFITEVFCLPRVVWVDSDRIKFTHDLTAEDLDDAFEHGRFGSRPFSLDRDSDEQRKLTSDLIRTYILTAPVFAAYPGANLGFCADVLSRMDPEHWPGRNVPDGTFPDYLVERFIRDRYRRQSRISTLDDPNSSEPWISPHGFQHQSF